MQLGDLYITGTGASLPERMSVDDAVAAGLVSATRASKSKVRGVPVAPAGTAYPDLAVEAAKVALKRASVPPHEVSTLVHAVAFHGGVDVWPESSYVAAGVGAPNAWNLGVRAVCNGAGLGLDVALARLRCRDASVALVTTADVWSADHINRWETLPGFAFGDGGGALVVGREPEGETVARVLSLHTHADASLEGLLRGLAPWGPLPGGSRISLRERGDQFFGDVSREDVNRRRDDGLIETVARAAAEANYSPAEFSQVILSFAGAPLFEREFAIPLRQLGITADQTGVTQEYGRDVGHLGAGDAIVALNALFERDAVRSHDLVLMVFIGGGYTWTAVALEIL